MTPNNAFSVILLLQLYLRLTIWLSYCSDANELLQNFFGSLCLEQLSLGTTIKRWKALIKSVVEPRAFPTSLPHASWHCEQTIEKLSSRRSEDRVQRWSETKGGRRHVRHILGALSRSRRDRHRNSALPPRASLFVETFSLSPSLSATSPAAAVNRSDVVIVWSIYKPRGSPRPSPCLGYRTLFPRRCASSSGKIYLNYGRKDPSFVFLYRRGRSFLWSIKL